ncbi:ROK family protein [Actinoalloteichus hymeniacidonis]|uniref:Transcriptional regulator/sugar kinase n=1 Tax=Actinoalloteichus hymeniacidonis TaxID=340345 RepID=A0AAC9MY34_9PSEU|nr:ROK family protein [Actinoalloteichus hymeniacidonis]AOS62582.1 transcriptional regulator/sugar kinase [Actinoalloteichus hymeniacidonis]MBB5909387.1 glucokinase [Actinoalloteichus hymeniacidonis]
MSDRQNSTEVPAADDFVLGLDVGGTKLAAGVVSADGRVQAFTVTPTGAGDGPEQVIARLCRLARDTVSSAGLRLADLTAVGICCCGPLDSRSGVVHDPPNLLGWGDVPLADLVAAELGVRVWVENDATAATVGEWRFGAGRGIRDLLYFTVSTGVGSGAVIDGRVFRGGRGNGGELGHTLMVADGRLCGCGARGCLEAYASGTAIAARARERIDDGGHSTLAALTDINAADVARAARAGDALAHAVWRETTDLFAAALAGFINVFEPQLIVLGGGVARTGDQFLVPVRERARVLAMRPAGEIVEVRQAQLAEKAGVVGAAAAAFDRVTTGE